MNNDHAKDFRLQTINWNFKETREPSETTKAVAITLKKEKKHLQ